MSEWYVLLAFVAGVCVGQHLTIRAIEQIPNVGNKNEHPTSIRPPP